jgi:TolB-like protein
MRTLRLAFALVFLSPPLAQAATPTVAVLAFRDLSGSRGNVGEAIRETVTTDLKALGGLRVVERGQLDRVLAEQHLMQTGDVDPATAARLGKLLGATLIATGAYQRQEPTVRLTARFVSVETGEIVGTAKVDGRATELLRLQDKVTAELLRSAGLLAHAQRINERAARRPMLKSWKTLELYGDSVVAENDDKKVELLKKAVAEDAAFSYAADDLAALEKRMKKYQERAELSQDQRSRELMQQLQAEKDPTKVPIVASQLFSQLLMSRRYRTLSRLGRSIATGPLGATMMPMTNTRTDELALYFVFTADHLLKDEDSALRDGEELMRRFPASVYFSSVKMQMDTIIRDKRAFEEGKAKAADEVARMGSRERWDLCLVAQKYSSNHQCVEAQRLFRACFAARTNEHKGWYSSLLQCDLSLGDFAGARQDLERMEKEAPDLYEQLKTAYEMQIPVDG